MAEKKPLDQGIIARAIGAFKVLSGKQVAVDDGTGWFGPSNPIPQQVPEQQRDGVVGRQFDFGFGYNTRITPRSEEAVTFSQMRSLADGYDILRLVIETRKDQIAKMKFKIRPKNSDKDLDDRCKEIEEFLSFPDGQNCWQDWLRMIMEEVLVTDATTIYPWLTNGGKPYRFELMDGTTIKRVLDIRGRTPAAPMPAYQQILKGIPAIDYTADELVYAPRNKRVHKVYGYSPVEQIIMTVNIAMRRALHQLQYYTDGSTPDLLFQVPPDWNMTQIKEFNDWWNDTLAGNTGARRRAQFVPNGVTPLNTKEAILKDQYDEWLARVVCYAFSVSPQAFVKEQNRATAGTQQEMALEEGLLPLMLWVKSVVDLLIWKYFGAKDLEFVWNEDKDVDPNLQNQMEDRNVRNGTATINEIRAKRGQEPVEGGDVAMVLTASGYVPVKYEEPEEVPPPLTGAATGQVPGALPNAAPAGATPPAAADANDTKDGKAAGKEKVEKRAPGKKPVKPINRESAAHKRARKALAKGIHAIFKKQAEAIATHVVSKVAKATGPDDILDDADWEGWEEFNDLFGEQLALVGKQGAKQAYAQINYDDPAALELANNKAIDYAKQRSAELVGKRVLDDGSIVDNPNAEYSIDDATREMLRSDVTTAMEEGLSNDELADLLKDNYAFSEERAMTIARTETAFADTNGNMLLYKESGVVESKTWITGAECCDVCLELDNETVGLDEKFSDGSDAPPAHPNCRCDFLPVISTEEDDTQDE